MSAFLIHLGDLRLTFALAGAVAVWLVAAGPLRSACWWCAAYGGAIGVVAANKILYLGWGLHIPAVQFKAASGHAAGAAAVLPVALYLLAAWLMRDKAGTAMVIGWIVSVAVACALVAHCEHTASEALAGWGLGVAASATTWLRCRGRIGRPSWSGFGAGLACMTILTMALQMAPVGRWMAVVALMLSGEQRTHAWSDR